MAIHLDTGKLIELTESPVIGKAMGCTAKYSI
jgi:hypothetical protein